MAARSLGLPFPESSRPGLSRPSAAFSRGNQDVDARHKAGHDAFVGEIEPICDSLAIAGEGCMHDFGILEIYA